MAEAFFQDFFVPFVRVLRRIRCLVQVIDVHLNVLYFNINLLQLVHHLIKALVKELFIIAVTVLFLFLFDSLFESRVDQLHS